MFGRIHSCCAFWSANYVNRKDINQNIKNEIPLAEQKLVFMPLHIRPKDRFGLQSSSKRVVLF